MKKIFFLITLVFCVYSCSSDSTSDLPNEPEDNSILVTQLSSTSGYVNDIITIEGDNFGTTSTALIVKFSETQAELVSISNTELQVKIPPILVPNTYPITIERNGEIFPAGSFTILSEIAILAASSSGKLYNIGISTGNYSLLAQTSYEFLSFFASTNILRNNDDVFFFDVYGAEVNNIIRYNLQTEITETSQLTFPTDVVGDTRGVVAWTYDTVNNTIIAIINEHILIESLSTNYIVNIDPSTFEVTYTGISFQQRGVSSIELYNNKLYLSVLANDHEITIIDLANGATELVELSTDFKISKLSLTGNYLYAMKSIANTNSGSPVRINLDTLELEEFVENNSLDYGLISFVGNGYYNNNMYFNVIASSDFGYGLLKFDVSTNEYIKLPFMDNDIDINLRLLGVTN